MTGFPQLSGKDWGIGRRYFSDSLTYGLAEKAPEASWIEAKSGGDHEAGQRHCHGWHL